MRILFTICVLAITTLTANAQITTPQMASPRGLVGCTIGVTTITIDYGRPSVNGRTIWGDLVPYDQVWRAGANENTVFTTSTDIKINGRDLAAGSYGLHMIPTTGAWTLIFNTDHQAWGSYFYNKENDALRVTCTPTTGPHTELLTYAVPSSQNNTADIQLQWETMVVPITVTVDVGATVTENLRQQLTGLAGFTASNYSQAARWLVQNNTNIDLAEAWSARALAASQDFSTVMLAARIADLKNDHAKAAKLRKDALQTATNVQLNAYGYSLLQEGKVKEAIPVFVMNTERNPTDPNCWDSLGEAYATDKQNAKAKECFQKALSMNPPDAVRQNSEMWLKRL